MSFNDTYLSVLWRVLKRRNEEPTSSNFDDIGIVSTTITAVHAFNSSTLSFNETDSLD
jgi:hypothetical protein